MNWGGWILKNLARNRRRSLLTLASVTASLFLVAMLETGYHFLNAPSNSNQNELILVVSPRASMVTLMPLWYKERIVTLPGVSAVSPFDYFPGHYGGNDAVIPALALRANVALDFFPNWKVSQDARSTFLRERTGLLVGRKVAQKYGWHVGQRIHLNTTFLAKFGLPFVISGIYNSSNGGNSTLLHWDYLNKSLRLNNRAYQFWVRAEAARDVPHLTRSIDAMFRNAPVPTRTGTLKQFLLVFLNLLGNVKLMLLGIMAAVIFSVLLVVANTMAMSIRERTPEIATLRALGFRRGQILALLTAESVVLALMGALLAGLGASAAAHVLSGFALVGAMPAHLTVNGETFGLMALVAIALGLGSTLLPAYRASRVNIAEALRYVG